MDADHSSSLLAPESNLPVENGESTGQTVEVATSGQWIEPAVCVIFFALSQLIFAGVIPLNEREIPVQNLENVGDYVINLSLAEEYDGETVDDKMLVVLGVLLPFVLQEFLAWYRCRKFYGDVSWTICVHAVAHGVTAIAVTSIKRYVGYWRPIFYDLCQPDDNYAQCTSGSDNMRMSFPSGHASTSVCGCLLLTLYIHTAWGVPSLQAKDSTNKTKERLTRFISVVALLPMALALFIAASRVRDNMHFPADVVGGSVIAGSIAVYISGLWFS